MESLCEVPDTISLSDRLKSTLQEGDNDVGQDDIQSMFYDSNLYKLDNLLFAEISDVYQKVCNAKNMVFLSGNPLRICAKNEHWVLSNTFLYFSASHSNKSIVTNQTEFRDATTSSKTGNLPTRLQVRDFDQKSDTL